MKSKRRTLEGNIANQKYEAARNIERHLDIIHNTNATSETTDWRKGKAYFFRKNEEGLIIQERKLNEENVLINDRLVKIQEEDRGKGVSYAPGLQVGKDGVYIDCYPSPTHKKALNIMTKNNQISRHFQQRKLAKENILIAKFLESARSSYRREELAEKYQRNRQAYNLFNSKTQHYALHLGLVKAAKDHIERRNRLASMHYSAISASTPRKDYHSSSDKGSFLTSYDRAVLQESRNIHDIHDFYELRDLDRSFRHSHKKDWNASTFEQLLHKDSNRPQQPLLATSIYGSKKKNFQGAADYLSDRTLDIKTVATLIGNEARPSSAYQGKGNISPMKQRVDLLDVNIDRKCRPKSAPSYVSNQIVNSKEARADGKDLSPVIPHPIQLDNHRISPSVQSATPSHSPLRGSISDDQLLSPAMQKLNNLRKNVSFIDAVTEETVQQNSSKSASSPSLKQAIAEAVTAAVNDQPRPLATAATNPKAASNVPISVVERRASMMRRDSSGVPTVSTLGSEDPANSFEDKMILPLKKKIPLPSAIARTTSTVSELGMDEDPVLTPVSMEDNLYRRKSLILDMHFEEDPETGELIPRSRSKSRSADMLDGGLFGDDLEGEREVEVVNAANLILMNLKLKPCSKFHFPVRIDCMDAPRRQKLFGCPFLHSVDITIFDVGYFLPGNEDYEELEKIRVDSAANAALASETTSSYNELRGTNSSDERVKALQQQSGQKSRSSLIPSPALRRVQGLSLPTSTGLLIVVNPVVTDEDEHGMIAPVYQYLSLYQAMNAAFSVSENNLPRSVFSTILSLAYPYGPDPPTETPRDINSFRTRYDSQSEKGLTIDFDFYRPLITPCLMDMMDSEIMSCFLDTVRNGLRISWEVYGRKLRLDSDNISPDSYCI
eukprot:gene3965-4337_t